MEATPMDPEIKSAIIQTLHEVRANFISSSVGRRPVERVVTAAVGALDAWKSAGNAAERYYEALEHAWSRMGSTRAVAEGS